MSTTECARTGTAQCSGDQERAFSDGAEDNWAGLRDEGGVAKAQWAGLEDERDLTEAH